MLKTLNAKTFEQLHVNLFANPDGSRNVSGLSEEGEWLPAGRLMPPLVDSRQQPKSLAAKLIEARTAHLRPVE